MFGRLADSPITIILILVVVLLLFGAPKLPGMARSLGQSMRIFKSEVKEMKKDDDPNVTVNGQPAADGQPVAGAPAQRAAPAQPQAPAQPAAPVQPQATQQAPVVDQNQRPTA
ncbi:Sec-independent protein translocase subunit TatA [Kocuria rhizophila]|uniref:Sec-independent protein translocase subunit TatA n=1 Tax=Kocuria rhizophila TaxID=72000 RepID=UPI0007500D72|nr:Sec-independent protein translocase subunit TatA [Kocuria rhizophila]KUP26829.1 preprotein translocase subunit TatA [Kocuria rhizophila]MCT1957531.1 Sec-independent protein translocase subunit TatA [Kocuria rhizophila]MCT2073173.1 Sec-independent protein translocase subunit TatA [Kocuria rhizophila]PMR90089.1 twin-arginine translocase TatA/TatE family subunit [Kocuria rhizophila]